MSNRQPPAGVKERFPLARLSTVRTGGAWASGAGIEVSVVGSGSNLLIADQGVRGLVIKLDGSLAEIELEGERIRCGAGARLPAVAARAARAGLTGLEFGVNIPGTVGGAVKMNANAYEGELARVLEWVQICSGDGLERRTPDELGFAYRRSNLAPGEIVIRACFMLAPSDPKAVAANIAGMRARRHEAQPQGIRTFGSTFKNPDDPRAGGRSAGLLLAESGCNDLQVGGARPGGWGPALRPPPVLPRQPPAFRPELRQPPPACAPVPAPPLSAPVPAAAQARAGRSGPCAPLPPERCWHSTSCAGAGVCESG